MCGNDWAASSSPNLVSDGFRWEIAPHFTKLQTISLSVFLQGEILRGFEKCCYNENFMGGPLREDIRDPTRQPLPKFTCFIHIILSHHLRMLHCALLSTVIRQSIRCLLSVLCVLFSVQRAVESHRLQSPTHANTSYQQIQLHSACADVGKKINQIWQGFIVSSGERVNDTRYLEGGHCHENSDGTVTAGDEIL